MHAVAIFCLSNLCADELNFVSTSLYPFLAAVEVENFQIYELVECHIYK